MLLPKRSHEAANRSILAAKTRNSHEEDQMPDADDFDVEYFRNLLKGNSPKEENAPPTKPPRATAKKATRPPGKPAAAGATSTSKTGPKKRKQR